MKQTLTTAIALCALLAASCAFAQRLLRSRLPSGTRSVEQPPKGLPKETYEKVPEEHRRFVKDTIENKAQKVAGTEVVEKFDVIIEPAENGIAWTNGCGKSLIVRENSLSFGEWEWRKFSPDGRLAQIGRRNTFEELNWCDKRRDELILAYWNDPIVVAEAISNSVAGIKQESRSFSSLARRQELANLRTRLSPRQSRQLEERIPLEEAMALAKDGKGKGFYQLALRYALGDEVPKNRKTAYQMLVKACESNYANAVLIEGMCDESHFGDYYSWRIGSQPMQEYCGTSNFDDDKEEYVALTNEVAFARVMGKYERAKELGALAATNQIAALNKRLSDFRTKEAEAKEKADRENENDRRVKEMLEFIKEQK